MGGRQESRAKARFVLICVKDCDFQICAAEVCERSCVRACVCVCVCADRSPTHSQLYLNRVEFRINSSLPD